MTITFILPSFNELYDAHVSLGSLLCQTNQNWRAIVINNGANDRLREYVATHFQDERIRYIETPTNTGTDNTSRAYAYNELIETELVVSSSIQDYYFPQTVDEILKVAHGYDFIYWNSINHLYLDNHILYADPEINKIDWGNFCIRKELAQRVLFDISKYPPDGNYVLDLKRANAKMVKIDKVLTIHN